MSGSLALRNRQHTRPVDLRFLRRMARSLVEELFPIESYDLGIYLVGAPKMAHLNETFLRHKGSTDVITFDHSDDPAALLHAEIFVCVDEAVAQARRFRTTWQSEVARYLIHGMLHLQGHGDLQPAARRKMKLKENQLLRKLAKQFRLARISKPHRRNPKSPK